MELGLLSVFAAGLLTLVTPCVLPMLPVYFTLLLGTGVDATRTPEGRRRLVTAATLFVAGFSSVFTLLGMVASGLGRILDGNRTALLVGGGLLIAVFGLKYLGVLRIGFLDRTVQMSPVKRAAGGVHAFFFGVVFALGWTPCVGPILGSVLTYTASTTSSPALGALYLLTYSLGVGLPLIGLSLAAETLLPRVRRLGRYLPIIERATGAAMVALGLWLALPALIAPATAADHDHSGFVSDQGPVTPPLGAPSPLPRLVELYAHDCPVCERMKPRLAQLRSDCMGRRIEILELNVSDAHNAELVASLGIRAVPVVLLYDEHGQRREVLFGERGVDELRSAAAGLLADTCAGEVERADLAAKQSPACGVAPAAATSADPAASASPDPNAPEPTQCSEVPPP